MDGFAVLAQIAKTGSTGGRTVSKLYGDSTEPAQSSMKQIVDSFVHGGMDGDKPRNLAYTAALRSLVDPLGPRQRVLDVGTGPKAKLLSLMDTFLPSKLRKGDTPHAFAAIEGNQPHATLAEAALANMKSPLLSAVQKVAVGIVGGTPDPLPLVQFTDGANIKGTTVVLQELLGNMAGWEGVAPVIKAVQNAIGAQPGQVQFVPEYAATLALPVLASTKQISVGKVQIADRFALISRMRILEMYHDSNINGAAHMVDFYKFSSKKLMQKVTSTTFYNAEYTDLPGTCNGLACWIWCCTAMEKVATVEETNFVPDAEDAFPYGSSLRQLTGNIQEDDLLKMHSFSSLLNDAGSKHATNWFNVFIPFPNSVTLTGEEKLKVKTVVTQTSTFPVYHFLVTKGEDEVILDYTMSNYNLGPERLPGKSAKPPAAQAAAQEEAEQGAAGNGPQEGAAGYDNYDQPEIDYGDYVAQAGPPQGDDEEEPYLPQLPPVEEEQQGDEEMEEDEEENDGDEDEEQLEEMALGDYAFRDLYSHNPDKEGLFESRVGLAYVEIDDMAPDMERRIFPSLDRYTAVTSEGINARMKTLLHLNGMVLLPVSQKHIKSLKESSDRDLTRHRHRSPYDGYLFHLRHFMMELDGDYAVSQVPDTDMPEEEDVGVNSFNTTYVNASNETDLSNVFYLSDYADSAEAIGGDADHLEKLQGFLLIRMEDSREQQLGVRACAAVSWQTEEPGEDLPLRVRFRRPESSEDETTTDTDTLLHVTLCAAIWKGLSAKSRGALRYTHYNLDVSWSDEEEEAVLQSLRLATSLFIRLWTDLRDRDGHANNPLATLSTLTTAVFRQRTDLEVNPRVNTGIMGSLAVRSGIPYAV